MKEDGMQKVELVIDSEATVQLEVKSEEKMTVGIR